MLQVVERQSEGAVRRDEAKQNDIGYRRRTQPQGFTVCVYLTCANFQLMQPSAHWFWEALDRVDEHSTPRAQHRQLAQAFKAVESDQDICSSPPDQGARLVTDD
jgi:hypothetical protein